MRSSKSDLPGSRKASNRQPYFPSLLTTPIPDSRKFIPSHHLVSDVSLLSEAEQTIHSKKKANSRCCCRSSNSSSSSLQSQGADPQMIEFIKKQEEQLQLLSKQMQELLNIHKAPRSISDCQSSSSLKSVCSNERITKQSVIENHHTRNKENNSPILTHRSIETMTSFVGNNIAGERNSRNDQRNNSKNKDLNKSLDYLDTSIEKVREDMRKDIDNAISTPISQRMSSMYVEPGTIYHTPNERSTNSNNSSKLSDNTSSSKNHRSSCSVTPEKGVYYRTSSPKRHSKNSTNPFASSEETNPFKVPHQRQTFRRVYHSEQSFYVEQLASKYDVEDDSQFPDITQYKQLPIGGSRHHRPEYQTAPKTLWSDSIVDENDKDLQKYSLSNMNTSVATRRHLEKYGLLNEKPPKK